MTEKELQDQNRSDCEWVTSTEQGRRFMWSILSHCGIYRDIEGDSTDMLKQVGRRQVGLHLLALISDASEDRIFDMMREAKQRSIQEKLENERRNQTNRNNIDDIIGNGELPSYSINTSGSEPDF
jgi:hypothetical protein